MSAVSAPAGRSSAARVRGTPWHRLALGVASLGVVFGDIGTSPLYAFAQVFAGVHPIAVTEARVLGAVSLVFWTLTLIVSVKYVTIVMRADNDGEGGIIALSALAVRTGIRSRRGRVVLSALGILGAALFYGDGMITPAISVLSAVEGVEVAAPSLAPWIVPIVLVVLAGLFLVQRHGAGRVGLAFGPIMLVWFIAIAAVGLASLVHEPRVLVAVSPTYAISFFVGEPLLAFTALGSVVLCVTGAEALYADMGQFGRGPIRLSWYLIVTPALYLTYFGQAAVVIHNSGASENPFYMMVPGPWRWPMIALATIATVIASQAVISGAFSMTRQAIRLGYLPRLTVTHTSPTERGQVYAPGINWILMIAVIAIVASFRTSDNLAAAYGIAVTGTFLITTLLITVVAISGWGLSHWLVVPVAGVFFVIDGAFFSSNLTKFDHGGWFPLAVAAIIFVLLTTWRRGHELATQRLAEISLPLVDLAARSKDMPLARLDRSAVYFSPDVATAPYALVRHMRLLRIVADRTFILHMSTLRKPRTEPDERVTVSSVAPGFTLVMLTYGYMERPDVPEALAQATALGADLDPESVVYVIHRISIVPAHSSQMTLPRQELFTVMQRLSADPGPYLRLPNDRVLQMGMLIRL